MGFTARAKRDEMVHVLPPLIPSRKIRPVSTAIMILASLVAIVLFVGIVLFAMGGEANRKHSVKLMWIRVGAQAFVVGLVVLGVFLGQ